MAPSVGHWIVSLASFGMATILLIYVVAQRKELPQRVYVVENKTLIPTGAADYWVFCDGDIPDNIHSFPKGTMQV